MGYWPKIVLRFFFFLLSIPPLLKKRGVGVYWLISVRSSVLPFFRPSVLPLFRYTKVFLVYLEKFTSLNL